MDRTEALYNAHGIKSFLEREKIYVKDVIPISGWAFTLYKVFPEKGVRYDRVIRVLRTMAKEIEGFTNMHISMLEKSIGVSIPNGDRKFCLVDRALEVSREKWMDMNLPVLLGEACDEIQFVDLREAPQLLVAGGTKSERDAFLKQAMRSICAAREPEEVEFYLFGEQMNEWQSESVSCVYCDEESISAGLDKLVSTMENRYKKLAEKLRRASRTTFEALRYSLPYPYIVAIIDRIDKNIEDNVLQLSMKGRGVRIHLILSAQSASKKILTSRLKVNFPAMVSFRTETAAESKNIIYCEGAECLVGRGDMLFLDVWGIQRIQMCREE